MAENKSKLRKVIKWLLVIAAVFGVIGAVLGLYIYKEWPSHSTPSTPPEQIKLSGDPTLDSIRKGLEFLRVHQEQDGNFVSGSLAPKPAFTSLAVEAFITSPDGYSVKKDPFLRKAVDAIVAEQKKSGSINTEIPGMSFKSYSTSVSLVTLTKIKDEQYKPYIEKATAYLKKDQQPAGSLSEGGFGYGDGSRADLNNTCTILDALESAGVPKDDPVWENARTFIARCQNRSESNDQEWAENDGGFIYTPVGVKKGEVDRDGNPRNASYGTMSYAGLISFLYTDVSKDDPRVKSAYNWIKNNYNLDENVNKKGMGLYYYYRIMAKALHKYGERYITTADGVKHDWPKELAARLVSLQKKDGSWVNENQTFLENDPILVTSYVVRALSICYDEMKSGEK
ncbi:MAG: terpene cyclase/mutase family protein [Planctomycetes bacterium]|nr:terpene cyclase/mutase family protein [Planctomycetota bacterium]